MTSRSLLLIAPLIALCTITPAAEVRIDWPAFMARQDLVWDRVPRAWHEGAFLGNGLLGTMVWAQGEEALHFDVGRSDVADRGGRIAIGRFELITDKVKSGSMRLDLWNAEARGILNTAAGKVQWRCYTHATDLVNLVDLTPGQADVKFEFRHEPALDARKVHKKEPIADNERNPEPQMGKSGNVNWCLQPFKAGGGYVVAWSETAGATRRLAWTVDYLAAGKPTVDAAVALISRTLAAKPAEIDASHRAWWHAWWPNSFVSIPDTRLENFYYAQIYKLASATRADRPAIDLMGPWFRTTPWPKIWWNLNIQLTYWPVYTGNRLDLGQSLTRLLDAGTPNLIANVPEAMRSDSAGIGRTSSYDCRGGAGSELGNLTWALHCYWLQYRCSGDETMLHQRLFPLLKRSATYMIRNLTPGPDQKLHFPLDVSPEYPTKALDTNYNLTLLRWALQVLIATNDRLQLHDPAAAQWKETLEKLAPFPYDEKTGYMIGANVPLAMSHRHFSHLLMFYPLHIVDPDDPAERARLEKSLDHWIGFEGALQGYSFTGASAMSSWLRRKDMALSLLNQFVDRYVKANTMYLEAGPVIETPLAGAAAIHEILLQSATPDPFGTLVRVFPAVPDAWKDVTIHNLAAEGAFLVSAARRGGKTRFVQITSLAGNPCRVETGMEQPVVIAGSSKKLTTEKDAAGRDITLIDLPKGQTVTLVAGGEAPVDGRVIQPVTAPEDSGNFFGSPKPRSIKQGPDGVLQLWARDGAVVGTMMFLEKKNRDGNFGRWTLASDYATWSVAVAKPGSYKVQATYAATGGGKKWAVALETSTDNERKTLATVAAQTNGTGGWDQFKTFDLGTLQIPAAGKYEITARGMDAAPMVNLESIQLTPIP